MGIFEKNRVDFQKEIGGTDFGNLGQIVDKIVPFVFGAAGLFLLFYLITGGFGIMTSKGDPKALEAARQKITTALIGFIIIFVSYWIVQLFGAILGVQQIEKAF